MTQDFIQALPVYAAADITVISGANLGDPISFADELDLDDVYELRSEAAVQRLTVAPGKGGALAIAPDSGLGRAGNAVYLDATLTMMTHTGATTEVLVLVEVDNAGDIDAIYVMPLAQLAARTDYTLVGIDRSSARTRFAEVACVSFARGTHITMASGAQVPIEDLGLGDMVLTRDDGPRPLRWIGRATVRAVGDFAPVRIKAGALNNAGDLTVSPESRLFIYQRSDALGAGRAEVLVRARHLVNGDTVTQPHGGFVDYLQLLFDDHQIIYAEGIATETMLVDPRTRDALPPGLAGDPAARPADHPRRAHMDFEVRQGLVKRPDAAALLRRASGG
ncbi:Hint domain-containing protein [Roseovarius dicentrarchi]|uniref:Hint domain-containing protein n=1 Tax=Roseovarius dicentrarchi TaxID=2250573 RepID=UPI000DEA8508|nr:Hint domain-containing protein [Roseovarius dicentrarchi]